MEFVVTIPDDAHTVFELMHFCRTRRIEMRPYRKKGPIGVRIPGQPPASEMNPPSPVRKAILQALESGPMQKPGLQAKLSKYSTMAINASLHTNREAGWVALRNKRYYLTKNGKIELARLEKKG
jgi:hypothetical protein